MSSVSQLDPNRCLVITDTFGSAVIGTHAMPPPLKISVMWFALEQSLSHLNPSLSPQFPIILTLYSIPKCDSAVRLLDSD